MADERFLVTGGTGCIGSWVVRDLVREDVPVTCSAPAGGRDRLAADPDRAELARRRRSSRRRHRPRDRSRRQARRRGRDADRPPRRAAAPVLRRGPVAGARVNVQGTAHDVRAGAAPRDRPRSSTRAAPRSTGPKDHYAEEVLGPDAELLPHLPLRRVQGRQRAGRARLLAERRDREHRAPAPLRVRPGPRPGRHLQADAGDDRGGGRASVPRRLRRRATSSSSWTTCAARSSPRRAPTARAPCSASAAADRRRRDRGRHRGPGARSRGRITFGDRVLPFPAAFDGRRSRRHSGARPLTPLADGVRRTIETYRAAIGRRARGRRVPRPTRSPPDAASPREQRRASSAHARAASSTSMVRIPPRPARNGASPRIARCELRVEVLVGALFGGYAPTAGPPVRSTPQADSARSPTPHPRSRRRPAKIAWVCTSVEAGRTRAP